MSDYDSRGPNPYNSMQAQAGLLPPFSAPIAPIMFPGQVSAMMAQGGPGMAFMGMGSPGTSFGAGVFPTQQLQTFTNSSPYVQGPTGVMMPMSPGAPYNPYGAPSPHPPGPSGPNVFSPMAPMAPPAYAGYQGSITPFLAPPAAMFQNPYTAGVYQNQATSDRAFASSSGALGVGARIGTNGLFGLAGAALGGYFGGSAGAALGGAAGFFGAEQMGMGQAGQNGFMNNIMAPMINMRANGAGIEALSRGFVSGGPFTHESGMGFSRQASIQSARLLEDMGNSSSFRRETFNRFNQGDVMKMTQLGAENGLMEGVGSPTQMRDRVRDIAKSMNAFMELANEPDIQRAIQTMGQLRSSGLNLGETLQAVTNGRSFARMAGTSFQDLAAVGGAMGSQTYQSMGMSQGLGFQVGMGNYGMARAAQNAGSLSPQLMNLMGGAAGYANMNNMFSGSFLQMSMLGPGMMSANGGLNSGALQGLMSGQMNPFSMTGRGANVLSQMAGRHGVEGLGMAIGMQPLIQDTIGRIMEQRGPHVRRMTEDRQVLGLSGQMGMHGSAGYMLAAQAMGMDRSQAVARAMEMGDPRYYQRMRSETLTHGLEAHATEMRGIESRTPGFVDNLASSSGYLYGGRDFVRGVGRGARDLVESYTGGGADSGYMPTTREELSRYRRGFSGGAFARSLRNMPAAISTHQQNFGRFEESLDIMNGQGARGVTALSSSIVGLVMDSDSDRAGKLNTLSHSRRIASQLRNSTQAERRSANEHVDGLFGSAETQNAFAADVANIYGNAATTTGSHLGDGLINGVARLSSQAAMGIDVGNVVGSRAVDPAQIRQAYVSRMMRRGQTREQAESTYSRDESRILASISTTSRAMMTDSEFSSMEHNATRGSSRSTGTIDVREQEAQTYGAIYGGAVGSNARSRRAIDSAFRMFGDGVGTDENTRAKSRQFMASWAMLQSAMRDPDRRDAARRQMQALKADASRQGVDVEASLTRVNDHRGDVSSNNDLHAATRTIDIGAMNMRSAGVFEQDRDNNGRVRDFAAGLRQMDESRGAIHGLVAGVMKDGKIDSARFAQNLGNASREDIQDLERQDRNLAPLIRQYQSATGSRKEAIMGQIQASIAQDRGAQDNALSRSYQRMGFGDRMGRSYNEGHGGLGGVLNMLGDAWGGEDRFIRKHRATGTGAVDEMGQSLGDIDRMESEAQGAGIGVASDQLMTASRELREAAETLKGAVSGDSVTNLIHRNNL